MLTQFLAAMGGLLTGFGIMILLALVFARQRPFDGKHEISFVRLRMRCRKCGHQGAFVNIEAEKDAACAKT